jgi:hypothetical protein
MDGARWLTDATPARERNGMEIQSLKLLVTDADVAAMAAKALRDHDGVEDLKVRLTPEGVLLQGEYPTSFFKVSFETTWQVTAAGPEVHVRLGAVKVAGLPAGILRGALMKMIRDAVATVDGVRVQEETIYIHVPAALKSQGMDLLVHFTAVRMSIGAVVLEAVSP